MKPTHLLYLILLAASLRPATAAATDLSCIFQPAIEFSYDISILAKQNQVHIKHLQPTQTDIDKLIVETDNLHTRLRDRIEGREAEKQANEFYLAGLRSLPRAVSAEFTIDATLIYEHGVLLVEFYNTPEDKVTLDIDLNSKQASLNSINERAPGSCEIIQAD